jgi:tetratricopeptide (TPR) repeat protein
VKYYRGELDLAEQLAEQALEWLERTGDTDLQIQNHRSLARYAIARGDYGVAERRLRDVLPLALELGGWLATDIYRFLAETLVRQGRVEDAAELVAFAARSVPEEDHYARAALLIAQAIVATESGESTAAATAFAEALRLMEDQELQLDLGERGSSSRARFAPSATSMGLVPSSSAHARRSHAWAREPWSPRSTSSSSCSWRGPTASAPSADLSHFPKCIRVSSQDHALCLRCGSRLVTRSGVSGPRKSPNGAVLGAVRECSQRPGLRV